jgi:ribosomal protein S6--L-glutamate ligase
VVLSKAGIPIPPTLSGEGMFEAYGAVKGFGRAVVKPLRSGKGIGVFKLEDQDMAMHIFNYMTSSNKPIYVQKYLEKEGGGDYRVMVVGGKVLGAIFRKSDSWKSNVARGASATKVKPDSELCEMSISATEKLGLDYGGVDILRTKEGYSVLEVNPTVAWSGFRKATGINPAGPIVELLVKKARR